LIKLVGEDNSWYVSCQGGSTESLQWQCKTSSKSLVQKYRQHPKIGYTVNKCIRNDWIYFLDQ
jgi:hypothetical protein